MTIEALIKSIQEGSQRGCSKFLIVDGSRFYCSAAIQKFNGSYKAHVCIIEESKMACEEFKESFTRTFSTIDEAIDCINSYSLIKFNEFNVLKGQKVFSPECDEEKNNN
jgi:hypothetical protein